ncbi:MAG: biotin/lipoyl-binding protein [Pseudoruegeria sp.]
MFELMFTSFPVIIRYFQLRRRGEAMSVWNMKTAVFLWAMLAGMLFLVIFYFHPKTYAALVPFRTISVVAQTSGPVTEINVRNGQSVKAGDLLFKIEDSAQKAALAEIESQIVILESDIAKAEDTKIVAQAGVDEIVANLVDLRETLSDAQTLLQRGVGTADAVLDAQTGVNAAEAELSAAEAQLDLAQIDLTSGLPAQRKALDNSIQSAKVALGFTEVRSFSDGVVQQLALSVGSPATTLILSPAMVIIPEREEGVATRIVAGFSQTSRTVLHVGMPAEIACNGNANILFENSIMPARIVGFQEAIATGQVKPSGNLIDLSNADQNGTYLAYFELLHPEHQDLILDGSGCIVQTYTNNISGTVGHIIGVTGVIKAVGLRLKVFGAVVAGTGLIGGGGH